METTTTIGKIELRRQMRAQLAAIDPERAREAGRAVVARLERLAAVAHARSVLVYVSRHHEVDTHELIRRFLAEGRRVAVPRFDEHTQQYTVSELRDFHDDLHRGKFDIFEPRPDRVRHLRVENLDVLLVPGLAFDERGNRLGRGRGYFDRLLQPSRGVKIGLAYDFQLLPEVPVGPHDVRMDFVVTETRTIHCGKH